MNPGLFICGCDPSSDRIKTYHAHTVVIQGKTVLTGRWWDKDGHEICPIHGKRLYGWASTAKNAPPADYKGGRVQLVDFAIRNSTPDIRDTRDPEEVGLAVLAERNGG